MKLIGVIAVIVIIVVGYNHLNSENDQPSCIHTDVANLCTPGSTTTIKKKA